MNPNRIKINISKSLQGKIRKGFPWVHFYQMNNRKISGKAGDLGVIYDSDNRFLAIGLFDPFSDIRLRILQTREPREIDETFFQERLQKALELRSPLKSQKTTAYRIVNGENDGFPGMVVDRYNDILVIKVYTSAWFPYLKMLVGLLEEMTGVRRVLLQLSRHVQRISENGYQDNQMLSGPNLEKPVRFRENGLSFEADLLHGQKTGFFLDQRDNRQKVRELAEGRSVLNVFSYTGAFSVYALAGGAKSVLEIDVNAQAQAAALKNWELNFGSDDNQKDRLRQIKGDAFEQLASLKREGRQFDLVILDPPAFASRKQNKQNALQAYLRLAKAGAQCTREGGLLVAASCSAQVRSEEFYRSVDLGIRATGRSYQKLLKTGHPLDHPVTFKEGAYLKAIYCQF
ncbi:MAG: class I SAM-dependent rRNA methyltransferase [Nitrospinota bacterium]|nr:class I SAM-dependent rRNA methyltransferase [Nitrospinota bacterium]MDH5789339.1 class I SAM-dependent rRNA methyltransferase [Nitrospinota bacterium]